MIHARCELIIAMLELGKVSRMNETINRDSVDPRIFFGLVC
jgi:hypothetical protein